MGATEGPKGSQSGGQSSMEVKRTGSKCSWWAHGTMGTVTIATPKTGYHDHRDSRVGSVTITITITITITKTHVQG